MRSGVVYEPDSYEYSKRYHESMGAGLDGGYSS
jgi:hypothetical protein